MKLEKACKILSMGGKNSLVLRFEYELLKMKNT